MEPVLSTTIPSPGEISDSAVYTRAELSRRLGLNDDALRKARRAGLKARKVGRRKYYLGAEVIDFLKKCPQV